MQEQNRKQVGFYLPADLYKNFKRSLIDSAQTGSEVVESLIRQWLSGEQNAFKIDEDLKGWAIAFASAHDGDPSELVCAAIDFFRAHQPELEQVLESKGKTLKAFVVSEDLSGRVRDLESENESLRRDIDSLRRELGVHEELSDRLMRDPRSRMFAELSENLKLA